MHHVYYFWALSLRMLLTLLMGLPEPHRMGEDDALLPHNALYDFIGVSAPCQLRAMIRGGTVHDGVTVSVESESPMPSFAGMPEAVSRGSNVKNLYFSTIFFYAGQVAGVHTKVGYDRCKGELG